MSKTGNVNCRIGSLESRVVGRNFVVYVNCRIGSLEKIPLEKVPLEIVNCRIGSLEKSRKLSTL